MSTKSIIRTLIKFGKSPLNIEDPFLVQKSLLGGEKHLAVFDVGAYVGDITTTYAKIFPQATIYCFEPFPNSFNKLCHLTKSSSIKPFQIALSDQNSQVKLQINTDRSCNSMFPRPTTGAKYYSESSRYIGRIEVETQTLDTFCNTEGIADIDILKLDIEGAELKALKGALGKLSDKRIRLIFAEVMFVAHYEGGCLFHEVSEFLSRYDYTLFNLYNLKRARNGQLRWGNAIFLNPQMQEISVSTCS
ncbi:MAG: FkbM family methyltransferase [Planctomycetes bacterium]|nr:FkbM family methyltransferase [Planctomycetota bacterium]